jgi:hypothetical protein
MQGMNVGEGGGVGEETWALFKFNLFVLSTPPMGIAAVYVQYILPFTMDNIKFQLHV